MLLRGEKKDVEVSKTHKNGCIRYDRLDVKSHDQF